MFGSSHNKAASHTSLCFISVSSRRALHFRCFDRLIHFPDCCQRAQWDAHLANFGRKSSKRIRLITSSGTLSSGGKSAIGLVASRPILALMPPGPAEGSSSLPCALAMTTRPRSVGNRPKDALFVEDVNIIVDDNHVLEQHVSCEGGTDGVFRLARGPFSDRNVGVKPAIARDRHADTLHRGNGLAHGFEQRGLARHRAHQFMLGVAGVNVLEDVALAVCDGGDFDDLPIVGIHGMSGEFAKGSFYAADMRKNLTFDDHFRIRRY